MARLGLLTPMLICLGAAADHAVHKAHTISDSKTVVAAESHAVPQRLKFRNLRADTSSKSKLVLAQASTLRDSEHRQVKRFRSPQVLLRPQQTHETPANRSSTREKLGVVALTLLLLLLLGWIAELVCSVYSEYEKACEEVDALDWTFSEFLSYNFGTWMTWSQNARAVLLGVTAAMVFLCGSLIYFVLVAGSSIWVGARKTFIWMVAPDGGYSETTAEGGFMGGVMSVLGLLIFALLLTLLQKAFDGYMEMLRSGSEKVMEVGHVLVIGVSQTTLYLLHELCEAYRHEGGVAIVLLSGDITKQELEASIAASNLDMHGSRVIVRSGFAQYSSDLSFASASSARSVIILADHAKDKEVRDAFVMQALLVLQSEGWPQNGQITAECSLLGNKPTMEALGGTKTTLIMTERWMAKLFVQVSEQEGIGLIVSQLLGFEGSELYAQKAPEPIVGKRFSEIASHFPHAVVVGSIADDELQFGHYEDHTLHRDHDLLLLADGSDKGRSYQNASFTGTIAHIPGVRTPSLAAKERTVETILIAGWGSGIGPLLIELDRRVLPGTRIAVVSPKPEAKRSEIFARTQRRWGHTCENLTVEHVVGMLGSPTVWERLPKDFTWDKLSRIFILGDDSATDTRHSDACTIAAILQIRHLIALTGVGVSVPIVPEIQDPRSEHLCRICKISNYIDSSGMPVQALAAVSYQPKLRNVFKGLVSVDEQFGIHICDLADYMPAGMATPDMLSFTDIQAIVCQTGHVLIGWGKTPVEGQSSAMDAGLEKYFFDHTSVKELDWTANPADKVTKSPWGGKDRVVVLADHSRLSRRS